MALMVASVVILADPLTATAHKDGKVELYVADLEVKLTDGAHHVHAVVIDRDSGDIANGFDVVLSANSNNAGKVDPVKLVNRPDGRYEGVVDLSPGVWQFTLDASQGRSVIPAVASARTFKLSVDVDGTVTMAAAGRNWWLLLLAVTLAAVVVAGAALLCVRLRRGRLFAVAAAFPILVMVLITLLSRNAADPARGYVGAVIWATVLPILIVAAIGALKVARGVGNRSNPLSRAAVPQDTEVRVAKTTDSVLEVMQFTSVVELVTFAIGYLILSIRGSTPRIDGSHRIAMVGLIPLAGVLSLLGIGLGLLIRKSAGRQRDRDVVTAPDQEHL